MITSPLRKAQSLLPVRPGAAKKVPMVHTDVIRDVVDSAKARLEQKFQVDASWRVMSYSEVVEITNITESDLPLFFKLSNISNDQDSKSIKINGKITKEDVFLPNLRKIISILEKKIARNNEQIDKLTQIIKSKLRHKEDKNHILRFLKDKKKLEKQNDDFFAKIQNMEAILDTYRSTQENMQMVEILEVKLLVSQIR